MPLSVYALKLKSLLATTKQTGGKESSETRIWFYSWEGTGRKWAWHILWHSDWRDWG